MQITLKPLKGDNFKVEADPSEKIADVKKKIAEAKPDFPVEAQKLIYQGKILGDDATVEASGVKEDGFVVVMVAKAKPKEAPPAAEKAPEPAPAAAPPAADAGSAPDAAAQAAANVVAGAGMESTITELCNMGFARPEVERCLQAAFGNPDRAVEYLMNGIPDGVMADAGAAAPAPGAGSPPPAAGGAAGGGAFPAMPAPGAGPRAEVPPELQRLRQSPQFGQLAAMVAQNPQMLAQILPVLAQQDPQAMQAIQANPEAFMQMIQEEARGGGEGGPPAGAGGGLGMGGAQMAQLAQMLSQSPEMLEQMLPELLPGIEASDPQAAQAIRENPQLLVQMLQGAAAAGGGGGPPPGVIQLTEEENAAVERLAALGFDKQQAAEAYLACDKQEELAANYLFDNMGS